MRFQRIWAMPNKLTFQIKPIKELIEKYIKTEKPSVIIDPFANSSKYGTITNDLDPQFNTTYNMDALDFLRLLPSGSSDMALYDPPYSLRQVSESYKKFDMSVNMETTQSSYWANQKREIARVVKQGGIVVSCGWNSGGIGKKMGFEIIEILLVPHGGAHYDTIVTVERKIQQQLF